MNHDPLLREIAALATDAPADLLDRFAARWVNVEGPIGELFVAFTDHGIAYVRPSGPSASEEFRERFARPLIPASRPPAGLLPALRSGRSAGLKFDLRQSSRFQADVLRATQGIPRGEVRPYAWVAQRIGRPKAVRAVGSALGGNPVPLLLPCHRVIRSDSATGEYIFGSDTKKDLLRAENVNLDEAHALAERKTFYLGSDTTGIVCYPTCRNARRITAQHRHGFRTLAQAQTKGYRPCEHCHPL